MVHEAGHLATAKIFKVYCFEYAIGFGPKLFSKKRKNGETYFSIRAIPFGGFVSMYGESDEVPEGLEIDPSRSLLAIKKWKRAIIMAAGVTMNFLLALLIFFVYEVAFPTYTSRYGHVTIARNSLAYNSGLRSQDAVYATLYQSSSKTYVFYDDDATISYTSGETVNSYVGFDFTSLSLKNTSFYNHAISFEKKVFGTYVPLTYTHISFEEALNNTYPEDQKEEITAYIAASNYEKSGDNYKVTIALIRAYSDTKTSPIYAEFTLDKANYETFSKVPYNSEVTVAGRLYDKEVKGNTHRFIDIENNFLMPYPSLDNELFTHIPSGITGVPNKLSLCMYRQDEVDPAGRGNPFTFDNIELSKSGNKYYFPSNFGVSMQLDEHRNDFGSAVKETFVDFGDSATLIIRGLGHLFTPDGWRDVGGIIAIGVATTRVLQENGFGLFLYYWGLISVNLGIVNLLPFPGLDGWHLLVIAVEGITRKEIPSKVKNIVSAIGVLLLFVLMVLIIIKDVIGLF